MEGPASCFVSGHLAAALWVSKFAWIAPLRFVKHGDGWLVSLSKGWARSGIIVATVFCLLVITAVTCMLQLSPGGGRNVWVAVFFMSSALVGTMVYGAPRRMRRLITCLNKVKKIRSELKMQHWPTVGMRRQSILFILWVVASVALNILNFIVLLVLNNDRQYFLWQNSFGLLVLAIDSTTLMGEVQIILVIMHLHTCFRAVNNYLRDLLTDIEQKDCHAESSPYKAKNKFKRLDKCASSLKSRRKNIETRRPVLPYEAVCRASSAYVHACDVVRVVDSAYGSMLALLLGLYFFYLVTKIYYFIMSIVEEDALQHLKVVFAPIHFSVCIYNVARLAMIIEPCHITHAEMERTQDLLSHLMRHTRSVYDPLAVELGQFCRQIALNKVSYRPLDVTTMTRGLILKILNGIVTYLVILVNL